MKRRAGRTVVPGGRLVGGRPEGEMQGNGGKVPVRSPRRRCALCKKLYVPTLGPRQVYCNDCRVKP